MSLDNGVMMSNIREQHKKFQNNHEQQWQHMQHQMFSNKPLNAGIGNNIADGGNNVKEVANKLLMIDVDNANDGKAKDIDIVIEGKGAGERRNSYIPPGERRNSYIPPSGERRNSYIPPPGRQDDNTEDNVWPRRRKSTLIAQ